MDVSDAQAFRVVEPELPADCARLLKVLTGKRWWTKKRLAQHPGLGGMGEHSIGARMADLRRAGYVIEKMHAGGRVWLYRVLPAVVSS